MGYLWKDKGDKGTFTAQHSHFLKTLSVLVFKWDSEGSFGGSTMVLVISAPLVAFAAFLLEVDIVMRVPSVDSRKDEA